MSKSPIPIAGLKLSREITWKEDPNWEAVRKLPDYGPFMAICSKSTLFVDRSEKINRTTYRTLMFTVDYDPPGQNYKVKHTRILSAGEGRTILESFAQAYADCGIVVPLAGEMLARGFGGPSAAVPVDDDYIDLEDLLG